MTEINMGNKSCPFLTSPTHR